MVFLLTILILTREEGQKQNCLSDILWLYFSFQFPYFQISEEYIERPQKNPISITSSVPGTFFNCPHICSQFLSTIHPETTMSLQLGQGKESYSPSQLTLSILCPLFLQSTDPTFIVLKH